jgi:hypothetical protein
VHRSPPLFACFPLLAAALLTASTASAQDPVRADDSESKSVIANAPPRLQGGKIEDLVTYHEKLGAQVEAGEYAGMSSGDRRRLRKAQKQLLDTVAGHASYDELDENERLRVFNAHEAVLALIEGRADDRIVCHTSRRTGSHLRQVDCATAAERAQRSKDSENFLRRPTACLDKRVCKGSG